MRGPQTKIVSNSQGTT